MKALRSETLSVLDEVERLSGRGIQFLADPDLPVLTSVQTARNGAAYHVVRYKPAQEALDYLLIYQAGFLIRLFRCPPSQRFDFFPAADAGRKMEKLIRTALSDSEQKVTGPTKIADMIAQWALMTLRSLPVGMRVDRWIADRYPTMSQLQHAGIALQQQQNADALSQSLRGTPVPLALLGMYAAYALFADRMLGMRHYVLPYEAAGLSAAGQTLLNLWDDTPADPASDRTLVDTWAGQLGLDGWYDWLPYQP